MLQNLTVLISTIFLGIFLSSCHSVSEVNNDQIFRYNCHENIETLDPAFGRNLRGIWVMNQLFNGLVSLDDSLQIQPDLAYRWEQSKNGSRYTFYMRDDVYFHESSIFGDTKTRRVTAQDFVYSFDRLKNPQIASPGRWTLDQVKDYYAKNDSVLIINLKKSFSPFLGILSMKYLSVVPHEAFNQPSNSFGSKPIGTGPFYMKRWEKNLKLVLRKNKNYFEQDQQGNSLPYLESVAITFVPDKQSEFLLFLQGKLDLLNSLDLSYKDELLTTTGELRKKYHNSIRLSKSPYLNTEYIGIYMGGQSSEIQSKNIRQALNYGFDREAMIRYIKNNVGYAANSGFIPNGLNKHIGSVGYSYHPQKAKALVEEYKQISGNLKPTIRLSTDANYVDICEFLQKSFYEIGISISIEVLPPPALRQAKSSGKLELFRASWVADYPDAENYMLPFYSKNFTPFGPNYMHFSSKEFDSLYLEVVKEKNELKRNTLFQKLDQIIIDEAPIIPMYYDQAIRFTQPNVKNMTMNPVNMLNLKKVYKSTR